MERLRSLKRLVDISEPILAEDSTFFTIALSLNTVLEQLEEGAIHHDFLVALLLVLLAESGFRISSTSDTLKWERNTRLVNIPTNWKHQETGVYEIYFTMCNTDNTKLKLVGIPYGDKLVLNAVSNVGEKNVCSMVIQTLKYVDPYTNNLCFRYMNLKEISHRFKDEIVMPLRTEILLLLNLMGPTLESLPIELRMKIASMLSVRELGRLSICSKKLYESCSNQLLREKINCSKKRSENRKIRLSHYFKNY